MRLSIARAGGGSVACRAEFRCASCPPPWRFRSDCVSALPHYGFPVAGGAEAMRFAPSHRSGDFESLSGRRRCRLSQALSNLGQLRDFALLGIDDLLRDLLNLRMRCLL